MEPDDLRDPDATFYQSDADPLLGLADPGGADVAFIRFSTPPLLEFAGMTRDDDVTSVPPGIEPLLAPEDRSESTSDTRKETSVEGRTTPKDPKYLHGWRMGISMCAATAGIVFVINLVLTIWASATYGLKEGGLGTIQEGSCKDTARMSLWLHFFINVLSTLLLGASNYTMQCLASPTREEVDRAHHQNKWLDIGIPSVRNLTRIARHRIALWWFIACSGIPLHLFYNSAVFSTLSAQDYNVFIASPDLISGRAVNWSMPTRGDDDMETTLAYFRNLGNASIWEQLDNTACIRSYARPFVSARGDVVAVSAAVNTSFLIRLVAPSEISDVYGHDIPLNSSWICFGDFLNPLDGTCDINQILENASDWKLPAELRSDDILQYCPIQYCLSLVVEEHCQVQFSIMIMGVVMACNLLKAICMLLALRRQTSRALVTLGDAIEEFLVKPDGTTRFACLSGKNDFSGKRRRDVRSRWDGKGHLWFSSLSTKRWFVCYTL